VFTARYALSPYIKQIRFVFKGLNKPCTSMSLVTFFSSRALRVGFNGLCAYASVNHLHCHLYYLQHRMLLEYVVSINVALMSCWWSELY
jgi:hypothetical protein